jgi:hypothetical protein
MTRRARDLKVGDIVDFPYDNVRRVVLACSVLTDHLIASPDNIKAAAAIELTFVDGKWLFHPNAVV